LAINSDIGINGKVLTFVEDSAALKSFYDIDFNEIPPPEEILPGTLVLVEILATEDGVPSTRWSNTYFLKLDTGHYVWYGNQKESLKVQEAKAYEVTDYLLDYQEEGAQTEATEMNYYYANTTEDDQTFFGLPLPTDFLESGLTQADEYAFEQNLYDVTIVFNMNTVEIKNFYNLNDVIIDPPPSPEDMLPGTKVLVSIEATEDGVSSTRFRNMFLMKIDSIDEGNRYIWYGDQLDAP